MFRALCAALMVVALSQAEFIRAQAPNVATRESTMKATIDRIEKSARLVTLHDEVNGIQTIYVDPAIKVFDRLSVGDRVTVRYVESVVVQVRRDAKLEDARETTEEAKKANENVIHQARAVVTIEGIDSQGLFVTYRTKDGRKMMHAVQDKKLLDGVHVGDRIEVTLTRERAIAIDHVR